MDEEKNRHQKDEKKDEDKHEHEDSQEEEKQQQDNHASNEEKKKELEKLLKQMKEIEKQQKQQSPKGPKIVKVEFGGVFHPNPLLNFLMYFFLNLVVIYTVFEVFPFVEYADDLLSIGLFVLVYTGLEMLFRQYLVFNHFKFVLRTLGFIFFFGYLSIFYLLDTYFFARIAFVNETFLIIFVGMFIVVRYLLAQMIKQMLFKMKG